MNLLLFIIVVMVSFIIVRIGAIAFQLTGLEWSLAKFQALSCFSGTGFTTKESELITSHPQRRRIASILIVMGNAGFVTLVATFANSLRPNISLPGLQIPYLNLLIPNSILSLVNLLIIVTAVYFSFKLFTNNRFTKKLTDYLREKIIKRKIIKPVSFTEFMLMTGGYGITQIEAGKKSSILGKTIKKSGMRDFDILILAIEREGDFVPNPPADTKILLGDKITCFGKLDNIKKEFI
ncbi:MAG: TrkA C-terminal domain-containing protein [bacterium]